jgi:hypothetical protein
MFMLLLLKDLLAKFIITCTLKDKLSGCVSKTCQVKRNRRNPSKNSSNPRTPKTPKSSSLTHGFGMGIKRKITTKGSHINPPPNPQVQGPENTPRNPPREGSKNHHQEQMRTTQQSLEEPCRIIYTYRRGSYKV